MAVTVTQPTSQLGNTANAAVYSMAAFLPSANAKVIVIANASASLLGSISGVGGLEWSLLTSINPQALGHSFRMWEANVGAAPSSAATNLNYTGDNATGCTAAVLHLTGHNSGAAPIQTVAVASIGANPVITFTQPAGVSNAAIVAIAMNAAIGNVTAPAGWTLVPSSYGTPTTGLTVAYNTNFSGTTATFSTGNVTGMSYLAAEYALAPSAQPLAATALGTTQVTNATGKQVMASAILGGAISLATLLWKVVYVTIRLRP